MADFGTWVDEFEKMEPTSRENYIRAPFGWPGGKYRSLDKIIPEIRKRINRDGTFVDGCGGSGVISLNLCVPVSLKIFNDRHTGLIAFYRCLRSKDKFETLKERVRLTLHSREEFIWSRDSWEKCEDDVERAARWYYTVRMSFAQLGRNFGRATQGKPQQPQAYFNLIEDFNMFHNIFQSYQVENMDVLNLIEDYDNSKAVFYIDPDYIGTNPCYKHGVDHAELLNRISKARGCFILSGYNSSLYDSVEWDSVSQWETHVSMTSQAFTETNGLKGKENVMDRETKATEVLYIREAI